MSALHLGCPCYEGKNRNEFTSVAPRELPVVETCPYYGGVLTKRLGLTDLYNRRSTSV